MFEFPVGTPRPDWRSPTTKHGAKQPATPVKSFLFHNYHRYHTTPAQAMPAHSKASESTASKQLPASSSSLSSSPPPKPSPYDTKPAKALDVSSVDVSQPLESSHASPATSSATPNVSQSSLTSLLWPFGRRVTPTESHSVLDGTTRLDGRGGIGSANPQADPLRGIAATRRVVTEGVLDTRYKPAARRVTAIIVALPFALYLSYELFQRRFLGKEQRHFGAKPTPDQDASREPAERERGMDNA